MTVRKLLIREENGLETRVEYDGMAVALKGAANGVAELDAMGRVPSEQLPSYVDDVIEVANFAALPGTGEAGKIYITLYDNKTWRWSGSGYAEISASLALGETSATAYRGDRGATAYAHSQSTGNPHGTTAAQVGALAAANPTFTGTMTGPTLVAGTVAGPTLYAAEPAGASAVVAWGTGAGAAASMRWKLLKEGTAESGANAGSDLILNSYSDSGALIDAVLRAPRAAGSTVTIYRPLKLASSLSGTGIRPVVALSDGTIDDQGASAFRSTINAAAANHNHFSKLDVSASATLGAIDASAIKVVATDVILTLSGGVDGQGWDVICPDYTVGFYVPTGAKLYRYSGITTGPATYAPGGGRAIRVVRVDASTWIMPNLS